MSSKIYVLRDNVDITPLSETEFTEESIFQALIEKYPEILAGDLIDPINPRKWLLIQREKSISIEHGGGSRFSLDHLFVDQDGIPTFVEVKRSANTESRRLVVAQMLDYAANATKFWSIDELIKSYEYTNRSNENISLGSIGITLENEDLYWEQVISNLRMGKIRLLFVNDIIPIELKAIIEYLNEQMRYTDVLGIEIKQYLSKDAEDIKILVPRIIGNTERANQTKRPTSKRAYSNCDDFLESVTETPIKELFKKFFAHADENCFIIEQGTTGFSFSYIDNNGDKHVLLYGFGSDGVGSRNNRIDTTFDKLIALDSETLNFYKKEIAKLPFFKKISGSKPDNQKWDLSANSTHDELLSLLDVINNVIIKINENK